ncbi:serine aminopeptidase domain-containing protein [Candidatus Hakubella thermalkaliphila]|uniref:serine aminopeptidase domain-containing protein n=1 Tax=Candidatus Hakubella thermalkaliphila TaxID=2754717 RepID=UPI0015936DBD
MSSSPGRCYGVRFVKLIFLWERGYSVFAPDHRGHGRSEGERVHVDHFSDCLFDFQRD